MKPYDEESELATYLWRHYPQFFTPAEMKAKWAVTADMYSKTGRSHIADDILKLYVKDDPAALKLLEDGTEVFRRRAARRVLYNHASQVFVSRCVKCLRIVATPKAKQCLWCGYDWHKTPDSARV